MNKPHLTQIVVAPLGTVDEDDRTVLLYGIDQQGDLWEYAQDGPADYAGLAHTRQWRPA